MAIEIEYRWVFPQRHAAVLVRQLDAWQFQGRFHELTVMYDNPNPKLSFYRVEVDGRLRLRISRGASPNVGTRELIPDSGTALLTWKRRLRQTTSQGAERREEEIEVPIAIEQAEAARALLEEVLCCPRRSSYERFRSVFYGDGVEIVVDEFPFGTVLEIEAKRGSLTDMRLAMEALSLRESDASALSCDDTYRRLCIEQGRVEKTDILFDDPEMPLV